MADFLNGLDLFFQKTQDANATDSTCTSTINQNTFYQFSLIPSVVFTLAMAFTKKRRQTWLSLMDGRPGLIFPMDALTRSSRLSFACAFGATSLLVYQVLLNQQLAVDYEGPIALKTLIAVLSMMIYGMVFFPIFASLAVGTAFSYCLGSLFIWTFTVIDIYRVCECDYNRAGRVIVIIRSLPSLLCHSYLSLSLPYKFFMAYRKGRYLTPKDDLAKNKLTVSEVRHSYQGKHVRKLLQKPKIAKPTEGFLNKVMAIITGLVHRWIYHRESGFRYPSRLLSVMLTAWIVVYVITLELLVWITSILNMALDTLRLLLDEVGWEEQMDDVDGDRDFRKALLVAYYFADLTKTCLIIATTLACVLSCLTILHMLTNFRTNLYAMYRGDYRLIPSPDEKSAASLCVGCIKYAGFQVAYIVWSFVIAVLVLFIICMILGIIITLLKEGVTDWLVNRVLQIWPGVAMTIVLMVTQMLLAKKVFLQGDGEHLRLNNRRFFFVFTYFMFFYNIFLGLVSCLLRIIKAMVVGIIFLARLDNSTLPRKFEFFDPGFSAYQGFIQMEAAHTHPVVIVFIKLLMAMRLEHKKSTQEEGDNVCIEMDTVDKRPKGVRSSDIVLTEKEPDSEKKKTVNFSARFNWWVTYTLLQNPQIRIYRKGFIQAMRKARKEGIRIPISDKLISDFDLVKLLMEKEAERQEEEEAKKALKHHSSSSSLSHPIAALIFKDGDKNIKNTPKKEGLRTRFMFFKKKNDLVKGAAKQDEGKENKCDNNSVEKDTDESSSEKINENMPC